MDLKPRTGDDGSAPDTPAVPARRKIVPAVVLALVLGGGAVLVFSNLRAATMYFCNTDEVGVKGECSGDKRFRLQGTVVTGSVQDGTPLRFAVDFNRVTIPVTYNGRPGGIFREGIPVVVEGRMLTDGTFAGDNILVKHTEQYRAEHSDRTKDYEG